ncbi:MAG: adenylate cyclase [Thermoleophilaceae bacterium]|nr:adenylate cyclase [Thermoleophilaceae bacterium]
MNWDEEGLLDGLEGDEREARVQLLDQLHESGCEVGELRRAVEEERLALLPVERELGEYTLTAEDVAERAGVSADFLIAQRRALGLPQTAPDEKAFGEEDVEAIRDVKGFIEAGFDEEGLEDVTRVVGESMQRVARTVAELTAAAVLPSAGGNELDVGLRFAAAARELGPIMGKRLEYVFRLQLRELVRNEMVSRAQIASGELPGAEVINVSFADLVGFTKLGEDLPPDEVGRVAGRLARIAADIAEPPVRLVKTIGDAAMLVSPEVAPLVDATIALVRAADDEGEDFPQLRAGVARGEAIGRSGDWYGRPVNVASRVTGVARPGSVLVTEEVKDEAEEAFRWSFAGRRKLKNVTGQLPLFRARRLDGGGEDSA